jgi:hypothetical protein
MAIVLAQSGAYGMSVGYDFTMVHKAPQRTAGAPEALAPVLAKWPAANRPKYWALPVPA